MLKKLYFFVSLCVIPVFSSAHISNCPDSDFINLGTRFSAVGRIFSDESRFIGTGTLIKTSHPELRGRIVLTCAHNLEGRERTNTFFHLNNEKRHFTSWFLHPKFSKFNELMCFNVYDIALCLLDSPLAIEGAEIDIELEYQNIIERICITVGYGMTGHCNGLYCITDNKRRASYSLSSQDINNNHIEECNFVISKGKLTGEDADFFLKGNLALSNGRPSTSPLPLPHGLSGSGDSGGPIFYNEKVIAIVNSSSSMIERKMLLITRSALHEFGRKYEAAYIEELNNAINELKNNNPQRKEYLEEAVIEDDKVDSYSEPVTAALVRERSYCGFSEHDSSSDDEIYARLRLNTQKNVILTIHQKWISNSIQEFIKLVSQDGSAYLQPR